MTQSNRGFDFGNVRQSINRMIEDTVYFAGGALNLPVDIIDTGDAVLVLTVPLLGIRPESIDISVSGQYLTLQGETAPDDSYPTEAYLRRERRYGQFQRKVHLPVPVQADAARAELKNGALKITLPKVGATRSTTINVTSDNAAPAAPTTDTDGEIL